MYVHYQDLTENDIFTPPQEAKQYEEHSPEDSNIHNRMTYSGPDFISIYMYIFTYFIYIYMHTNI